MLNFQPFVHLLNFQPFQKGANICDCLLYCTPGHFLPFRVDPFSEGRQKQFGRVVSPESVSLFLYVGQGELFFYPATGFVLSLLDKTV